MNIILWIIIWYVTFAGYYIFFKKKNIFYKSHPRTIIVWYGLMSIVALFFFHTQIGWAISNTSLMFFIVGFLLLTGSVVALYKLLVRRDYVDTQVSRNIFAGKTAEIMFQQMMIWGLFGVLQGVLLIIPAVILFTLVFFVIHIPLMLVISFKKGILFTLASILGGLFFGVLLMYVPSGWMYAAIAHIGFYAFIASQKKIFGLGSFYNM